MQRTSRVIVATHRNHDNVKTMICTHGRATAQVKTFSAYGIKQENIATMVDLGSSKTLRKHFREELAREAIEATAQVGQTLF